MIPRFKPALGFEELKACLSFPKKDDVKRFENAFADLMGQKYALAFPYGRTGLMLLLEALGLKNKEIICPAYTCVVVPHAIVYSNNVPVFVDCKSGGFNMSLDIAEKAINEKTGAIIATSLFGYPVNLDRLYEIRKRHPHIYIIQDCAHSFSAEWNGQPVHKEGVAALFGLNISKILTSIFGGIITTDDEKLYNSLKRIRDKTLRPADWKKRLRRFCYFMTVYPVFFEKFYGIINRLERSGFLNYFVKYYDENKIDMPVDYHEKMTAVEARVGAANIKRYRTVISNRQAAAQYYFEHLNQFGAGSKTEVYEIPRAHSLLLDRLLLPPKVEGATYSHFVIQVPDRDIWLRKGIEIGLQLGSLIEYNIPEMPSYGSRKPGEFHTAAQYARKSVNLPVWGGEKLAKEVVQLLTSADFNG